MPCFSCVPLSVVRLCKRCRCAFVLDLVPFSLDLIRIFERRDPIATTLHQSELHVNWSVLLKLLRSLCLQGHQG